MRRTFTLIVTLTLSLLAVSDQPQLAYGDHYGAIAAAPDGRYGYSFDFDSRLGAERKALHECGRGCTVKLWSVAPTPG